MSWTANLDFMELEVPDVTTVYDETGRQVSVVATALRQDNARILRPDSTVTGANYDTGPTTGQPLHTYAGDDDFSTYVTRQV